MSTQDQPARRPSGDPDRTARARIRDAAIVRFAEHGMAAANLKDIAADAGVSTPLVLHHFGSKDGLRAACDEYVASVIKEQKTRAMAAGKSLDPFQAVRQAYEGRPIIRYMARAVADGSPHVDRLIDEMVEDSLVYMAEGVDKGLLKPAENPRERAALLCLWQLGALVLHEHVKRLLDVDLIDNTDGSVLKWARITSDVLSRGVLDETVYDQWRDAMRAAEQRTEQDPTPTTDRETT